MKLFLRLFAAATLLAATFAAEAAVKHSGITQDEVQRVASLPHPRLLLANDGVKTLRANAKTPFGSVINQMVLRDANRYLSAPITPREIDYGQRTLKYSREVLRKINTLATAWQLTGDRRYAERGKAELLAAAALPEWYFVYFLDCAEMTLAASIGYDWFYDELPPAERDKVAQAIIDKGIKASMIGRHFWISGSHNWTQVCHSAMSAGAIVTADRDPELALKTLNRAVANLPKVMKVSYYPNGAYPEGPGYWAYGTNFNALLIAMLDNAFGRDCGLSEAPGFSVTCDFSTASIGNTGIRFSYADTGRTAGLAFANIYLAKRFNRPGHLDEALLKRTKANAADPQAKNFERLMPLALLFADAVPEKLDHSDMPKVYFSGAQASTALAMLRTGFKSTDAYLGVKGGSPRDGHAHMDIGSFIYENQGVRWLDDLGGGNYAMFNKKGIKTLFSMKQDSDRWQVFNIGPESHNILRLGATGEQQVSGFGRITSVSETDVEMDTSTLYAPYAKSVIRRWHLEPSGNLTVTDRISGARPGTRVVFQILTTTPTPRLSDGGVELIGTPVVQAELFESTKSKRKKARATAKSAPVKLRVTASGAAGQWELAPSSRFEKKWDRPYQGVTVVSFVTTIPESGDLNLTMTFR